MPEGRQIPHEGEAIILRTWPFQEADLLVSLFTRDQGKVKGVARHALRSRKRFGGALEPATQVRALYLERPNQDLVRLDSFEILWSPLHAAVSPSRLAGLQLVTEVLEEALPELAPEDNIFRLALTALKSFQTEAHAGALRLPATYFCLWMNQLMGWMPELKRCKVCGTDLRGQTVCWSPNCDGVTCQDHRPANSRALSALSVSGAGLILRAPLAELLMQEARDTICPEGLLVFAVATLERHLERRLRSAPAFTLALTS
ncbi:MAG: DNA repair protein RecO [Acidobacteriaceae bacterium]